MNFNFFLFLLVDYELYLYLFDRELNQSAAEEEELDTFWENKFLHIIENISYS